MRTLLLFNLGIESSILDLLSNYDSIPQIGEICFAFNGNNLIGWVVVNSIDLTNQCVHYIVLDYQYDCE